MFLSANLACRLTYCSVEETSLWQDDQSDEDTVSSLQSSHVHDIAGTKSRRKARRADSVDKPVEDDKPQYDRVQIRIQSHVPSVVGSEELEYIFPTSPIGDHHEWEEIDNDGTPYLYQLTSIHAEVNNIGGGKSAGDWRHQSSIEHLDS